MNFDNFIEGGTFVVDKIGNEQLTKCGLGSSGDFVLKYLNHPENLKKLKILSEIHASSD